MDATLDSHGADMLNLKHVIDYIDETVSEYPRKDESVAGGVVNILRIPFKFTLELPEAERPALRAECRRIADKYGCEVHRDQLDILIRKPISIH